MTSQYRHRRTSSPSTPFPNPIEPGEIAVNTSNRQISVGDAASGSVGVPLPLLAVRFFDVRAIYAINDLVDQAGIIYRAKVANGPGAFNPSQWTAGGTQLFISDTAPVGVLPGSLWWESDTGVLYVYYDDGDSVQWVIASPQPDVSTYVNRAGDTMGGPLVLFADPAAPMQAATKQYVDAGDVTSTAAAAAKVAKAGDVMTGLLTLSADPTAVKHAATKQYVDAGDATNAAAITAGDATLTTAVNNRVRYDAPQVLTEAQALQARANIAAAPVTAVKDMNIAINGSMSVSQLIAVNATALMVNGALSMFADMTYSAYQHASAAITGYNGADVGTPPGILPPPGFTNCTAMYGGTAPSVLANGDYVIYHHKIEGTRWAKLGWSTSAAKPITIAFMFYTNDPGIGHVRVSNGAQNRFCHVEFNAPINGWNFVTVTVPGDTAASVWPKDTGVGAFINVFAAGKSATVVAPGAWGTVNSFQTTNSQNLIKTNTTTIGLTGFLVLPGLVTIPDAATLASMMRPIAEELLLCMRYHYVDPTPAWITFEGVSVGVGAGRVYFAAPLPVPMRVTPTVTLPFFSLTNIQAPLVSGTTQYGWGMNGIHNAAVGARMTCVYSSGPIRFDARL